MTRDDIARAIVDAADRGYPCNDADCARSCGVAGGTE